MLSRIFYQHSNKTKNIEIIGVHSRNIDVVAQNSKKFNCKTWGTTEEMLI